MTVINSITRPVEWGKYKLDGNNTSVNEMFLIGNSGLIKNACQAVWACLEILYLVKSENEKQFPSCVFVLNFSICISKGSWYATLLNVPCF